MAGEWPYVEFGDLLLNGTRNGVYKGKAFHGTGVKIVNMGELFAYPRLRDVPMKRVELTECELEKSSLQAGDLLFARRSLVAEGAGKCSIVIEVNEPTTFESSIIRARPDRTRADSLFLYYLFNSPQGRYLLGTILRQVAVSGITGTDLIKLKLPLPPLPEQKAIACILGALDDKIELSRRMNRTLEGMARAIFKSWFVDFDPVRAKAAGQPPPGMKPELAALFPDSFEDSKLGEIPKGWRVGVIGDIATHAIGGQWGEDDSGPGLVPAICLRGCDLEDLRSTGLASRAPTRFVKPKAIESRLPSDSDVLIAGSGAGPCGRPLWCSPLLRELYEAPVIYSNFVKRLTTPSPAHAVYLDRLLIGKFEDRTIHDFINGTSVPNLDSAGLLSGCTVLIPPATVLDAFASFCRALFARLYSKQATILGGLRDLLLPKLISGELRVPDAERIVARAVDAGFASAEAPPPAPPPVASRPAASTGRARQERDGRASKARKAAPVEEPEPEPESRLSIDDYTREDVLAAVRDLYRESSAPCDRDILLSLVRDRLGFKTLGPRIRERLEGDLLAAVRRGILERRDGAYHMLCRNIDEYERGFLKDLFLQALGRGWQEREDAVVQAARYLGFRRTGDNIRAAFKSVINGLIREGRIEAEGTRIRKV